MGLDVNGVQCLLFAKKLGIDFTRTMMIGRQGMYIDSTGLKKGLKKFGFSYNDDAIKTALNSSNGSRAYAEEFLRLFCNAETVHSLDYSDYEAATHIHDLNYEIPNNYSQQYSLVLDSGTLEHVFNFPVAIKNCMEMVKIDGHYIGISPANNFMGHGFYQFSPELWYAILSDANGFEICNVIAFEDDPQAEWFSVGNPTSIKHRVTLINDNPVYLFIIAKKVKKINMLETLPFQSDYIAGHPWSWTKSDENIDAHLKERNQKVERRNRLMAFALMCIPHKMKRLLKFLLRRNRGFNSQYFHPVKRDEGMIKPCEMPQKTR